MNLQGTFQFEGWGGVGSGRGISHTLMPRSLKRMLRLLRCAVGNTGAQRGRCTRAGAAMAEAGGSFVTRSFERMLKEASGRKYSNLRSALKAYLGMRIHSVPSASPWSPSCVCFCDCLGAIRQTNLTMLDYFVARLQTGRALM